MWSKNCPAKRNGHCIACTAIVADNIEDPEFAEDLRIYFNLPIMVPEILLPGRVTRQHFLQWHPRVFMPGSIWRTVSFLPCTMSSTEFRKERCSYLTFLFLTLESGRFWFIVLGDLYLCFWIFLTRFILFTTLLNVYSRQNEITCKLNRRQLRQDSELCQNDARS